MSRMRTTSTLRSKGAIATPGEPAASKRKAHRLVLACGMSVMSGATSTTRAFPFASATGAPHALDAGVRYATAIPVTRGSDHAAVSSSAPVPSNTSASSGRKKGAPPTLTSLRNHAVASVPKGSGCVGSTWPSKSVTRSFPIQ